jgi:hypothetical protein
MSASFGKNALTFNDVVKQLRTTFETFTDRRTGKNTNYTMTEAGRSAFSVFFMQSPSFLEFQRTMQKSQGKNNAQTLFGVFEIPTDNHIRSLLDAVESVALRDMQHERDFFKGI